MSATSRLAVGFFLIVVTTSAAAYWAWAIGAYDWIGFAALAGAMLPACPVAAWAANA